VVVVVVGGAVEVVVSDDGNEHPDAASARTVVIRPIRRMAASYGDPALPRGNQEQPTEGEQRASVGPDRVVAAHGAGVFGEEGLAIVAQVLQEGAGRPGAMILEAQVLGRVPGQDRLLRA
jgi:hypothetical protein